MQDLETINRLNAEAIERDIPRQQAKGKFVVAEYAGVHFVGYSTHTERSSAEHKLAQLNASGTSTHGKLFEPTAESTTQE